jgi:hypothetical protein
MSEKIIEDGSVVISMYSYNDLERANDCNKLLSGDNEDLADYYTWMLERTLKIMGTYEHSYTLTYAVTHTHTHT